MPEHSIRVIGHGPLVQVDVDGQRISDIVTDLTIDMVARQIPEVHLDLVGPDVDVALGRAHLRVGRRTREFLVGLGWAPPEEDR